VSSGYAQSVSQGPGIGLPCPCQIRRALAVSSAGHRPTVGCRPVHFSVLVLVRSSTTGRSHEGRWPARSYPFPHEPAPRRTSRRCLRWTLALRGSTGQTGRPDITRDWCDDASTVPPSVLGALDGPSGCHPPRPPRHTGFGAGSSRCDARRAVETVATRSSAKVAVEQRPSPYWASRFTFAADRRRSRYLIVLRELF